MNKILLHATCFCVVALTACGGGADSQTESTSPVDDNYEVIATLVDFDSNTVDVTTSTATTEIVPDGDGNALKIELSPDSKLVGCSAAA